MKWKKYFEYKIIDRGFSYYYDKKVHDMKISYNLITSIVDGSNNNKYEVEIYIDGDNIDTMYCTCPYACSTDYCKHMAATLYEYDDIMRDTIRDLKYDTLKKYSIDKFSPKTTINDFKKYKNILNKILDVNLTILPPDSPYTSCSLNRVLYDFMDNKIGLLYINNQFEFIQQLLYLIYEKIAIREDVEKYVDINVVLTWCNEYMMEVIRNQDITDKDKTYNYFIKILKNKYNTYTAIYILDLCLKCYTSRDYQRNTLNVVNDIIENKKIPSEIYYIKGQLMINLDYPYKDIKEELFMHRKSPTIQELLIESAIKDEEYDEAIRLLEANSKLEDIELIMNLYKKVGNTEKYKEKIKIMLFEYDEIKYLDQLKDVCTKKEWNNELKDIIETYKRKSKYEFINEICIYYHKYEDLYKNIVENCQIETLEKYRSYYQEEHSSDILNIYKQIILEKQQTARNRNAYNTLFEYLNTMLTYDNGKEIVCELVEYMLNNENNWGKKVFLKELRKYKYNLSI